MKRRQFLKAGAAISIIPLVNALPAKAEETEVSEDEPMAKALSYVKDAQMAKDPKYKKGDNCGNCMFFKPERNNGCQLFGYRTVEKGGWCLSWAPVSK
ncbi:hypothetical protein GZ77_03475 [Endozoicomonas montiporae]|uniref:High-potential iron-sulfur protein n=2 Tax=Endozoicomonas montiporae TaxID=1027273 RepID=A0A081NB34_9GAMM|nr:high-potential iron-sulfur protein [Endozoicomonas montiporae]AMO56637.1 high potential iron-sulfur protein [Endozoicomonas montiporae CL-33]KEQ15657.1 hypothetical protein GZ77_03475 [Endozoicomonas montiporae]